MIPTRYRQAPETSVVYNYQDVTQGAGYRIFYGYNEKLSGSITNYKLSTSQLFSYDIECSGSSTTSYTKIKDIDFDVMFNKSETIKGNTRFIIPYNTAAGGSPECWFRAWVRKWDGTTETDLAYAESEVIDATKGPSRVLNISCDVPETTIKKGEYLRITIEMWALSNPASKHAFYHDPQNRNGWDVAVGTDLGTTRLEIHVPFIIDE